MDIRTKIFKVLNSFCGYVNNENTRAMMKSAASAVITNGSSHFTMPFDGMRVTGVSSVSEGNAIYLQLTTEFVGNPRYKQEPVAGIHPLGFYEKFDLYVQESPYTLIARFGDSPGDYSSIQFFSHTSFWDGLDRFDVFMEAYRRASYIGHGIKRK